MPLFRFKVLRVISKCLIVPYVMSKVVVRKHANDHQFEISDLTNVLSRATFASAGNSRKALLFCQLKFTSSAEVL